MFPYSMQSDQEVSHQFTIVHRLLWPLMLLNKCVNKLLYANIVLPQMFTPVSNKARSAKATHNIIQLQGEHLAHNPTRHIIVTQLIFSTPLKAYHHELNSNLGN